MSIYDELSSILGSGVSSYDFLLAFVACVIFVYILVQFFNVLTALFKYIGGYR